MKRELFAFAAASLMMATSWAAQRVYLGTETVKTSDAIQGQLQLGGDVGHTILSIEPGSPAEKAGLQKNDIIVSINGRKIKNFQLLSKTISALYEKGEKIEIIYLNKGEEKKTSVTLDVKEVKEINNFDILAGNQDISKQSHPRIHKLQDQIQKALGRGAFTLNFTEKQNFSKQLQDQIQKALGGNSLANITSSVNVMTNITMMDGEHNISVSGNKDKKHVTVTNASTNEVEFEGDIINDDYSEVPEDLQQKIKSAASMTAAMGTGSGGFQLITPGSIQLSVPGIDPQPKAKDESSEKKDDFIQEMEKEESKDK